MQALKKLVAQGEGPTVEFKRKAKYPEKIMKEISAFANSKGGFLLLGVDDDRSIPGLGNPDEEEYLIEAAIRKHLKPVPPYTLRRIALSERAHVLVWHIESGPEKPYYVYPSEPNDNPKAYIRQGDQSNQASREVREYLKLMARGKDLSFQYGDKERLLMQYLEKQPFITVDEFARLVPVPRKVASRTLVLLAACQVLRIRTEEGKADRFERRD